MDSKENIAIDNILSKEYWKEKEYWQGRFSNEFTKSVVEYDFMSIGKNVKQYNSLTFKIEGDLNEKISWIVNNSDLRLYVLLTTCITIFLEKYTSNKDVLLGSPIFEQEIEGDFINTVLPIRLQLKDEETFKEVLFNVKQVIEEALENQNYPLRSLLYDLDIEYDTNNFALFDVVLILENLQSKAYIEHIASNLYFSFNKHEDSILLNIEYNNALYTQDTIQRIGTHFIYLMEQVLIKDTGVLLKDIDILSKEERHQLLYEFNTPGNENPKESVIHELIKSSSQRNHSKLALSYLNNQITFKCLEEQINRQAFFLREKGVKPGDVIAVLKERSDQTLVDLLSILKSGAAYLPIATKYPDKRIQYMMENSNCKYIITEPSQIERIHQKEKVIVKLNDKIQIPTNTEVKNVNSPTDLAYIIYTSGSTGNPKGVMIEHKSVINLTESINEIVYKNHPSIQRIAVVAPFEFDASVQQIYISLFKGMTLNIIPDSVKVDGKQIITYFNQRKIELTDGTPTHLRLINDSSKPERKLKNIKHLIIAGEVLPKKYIDDFYSHYDKSIQLTNCYGPTETCVDSTYFHIDLLQLGKYKNVPIGKPLLNEQVFILNEHNKMQPIGVAGELCISGAGLARAYIGNEQLTKERFIEHEGIRLYKTGDMARWLTDGNIEYISRKDHQVKLRGFRIELGEIEKRLIEFDGITEAVVLLNDENTENVSLNAYIVVSNKEIQKSSIMDFLVEYLPDYMLPSKYFIIDFIPFNQNGKLNKKELFKYNNILKSNQEHFEPSSQIEKDIAEIWKEILSIDIVSLNDNFFDVGGNSLNIVKLSKCLNTLLNKEISIIDLFRYPSINLFLEYIQGTTENNEESNKINENEGKSRLRNLKNQRTLNN